MDFITGKCLCGQITVSITKQAFYATDNVSVCHCKNCRQTGGSFASINVIVPESTVPISGQPKIYQDSNTESGNTIQRAFCSNCGSPISTTTPAKSGILIVKLGLFDEILKPVRELYCKARPCWNKPIDGAQQFDGTRTN